MCSINNSLSFKERVKCYINKKEEIEAEYKSKMEALNKEASDDILANCPIKIGDVYVTESNNAWGVKRNYYKAFILPKNLQQDFSVHTDSKEKSFARFRLFCKSIRGCKRDRVWDDLCYSFVVIKRACSLALSFRSFSPFFIVLKTYYND